MSNFCVVKPGEMDPVSSLLGLPGTKTLSYVPWELVSLNELMAMSQGTHSPRGRTHRKTAGLGGLKIEAQRHCAQLQSF